MLDAVKNHKKYFEGGDDSSQADSKSLGAAAAMQALKKFNSGEEDTKGSSGSSMQKFLSIAMAEASKVSSPPLPIPIPTPVKPSPTFPTRATKTWKYSRRAIEG